MADRDLSGTDTADPVVVYLLNQRYAAGPGDGGLFRRDWWQFWNDRLTEYREAQAAAEQRVIAETFGGDGTVTP